MIQKRGQYWAVVDRDGHVVSRHKRKAAAEAKEYRLGERRPRYYRAEYRAPRGYHYTRTGELRKNETATQRADRLSRID